MRYRLALLSMVLCAHTQFAIAQTPKPAPAQTDRHVQVSEDHHVVFEIRRITLPENFWERIPVVAEDQEQKLQAPDKRSFIVYDVTDSELLLNAAIGDRRSNVAEPTTVSLRNGEQHKWSPYGRSRETQSQDTIQATVSNEHKAIDIHLTWAERKNAMPRLPTSTATIPAGSSLLVHVKDRIEKQPAPSKSLLEQVVEQLLGQKWTIGSVDRAFGEYLLITPLVASEGAEGQSPIARQHHACLNASMGRPK